jgi:hypothetical protein
MLPCLQEPATCSYRWFYCAVRTDSTGSVNEVINILGFFVDCNIILSRNVFSFRYAWLSCRYRLEVCGTRGVCHSRCVPLEVWHSRCVALEVCATRGVCHSRCVPLEVCGTRGVCHSRCVPLFSGYKLKSRKVVEEVKWISYFCFRVDRNEVSFKVEPNNLGLNASDVAKKIGECRIICCNMNVIVKSTCSFAV